MRASWSLPVAEPDGVFARRSRHVGYSGTQGTPRRLAGWQVRRSDRRRLHRRAERVAVRRRPAECAARPARAAAGAVPAVGRCRPQPRTPRRLQERQRLPLPRTRRRTGRRRGRRACAHSAARAGLQVPLRPPLGERRLHGPLLCARIRRDAHVRNLVSQSATTRPAAAARTRIARSVPLRTARRTPTCAGSSSVSRRSCLARRRPPSSALSHPEQKSRSRASSAGYGRGWRRAPCRPPAGRSSARATSRRRCSRR